MQFWELQSALHSALQPTRASEEATSPPICGDCLASPVSARKDVPLSGSSAGSRTCTRQPVYQSGTLINCLKHTFLDRKSNPSTSCTRLEDHTLRVDLLLLLSSPIILCISYLHVKFETCYTLATLMRKKSGRPNPDTCPRRLELRALRG